MYYVRSSLPLTALYSAGYCCMAAVHLIYVIILYFVFDILILKFCQSFSLQIVALISEIKVNFFTRGSYSL